MFYCCTSSLTFATMFVLSLVVWSNYFIHKVLFNFIYILDIFHFSQIQIHSLSSSKIKEYPNQGKRIAFLRNQPNHPRETLHFVVVVAAADDDADASLLVPVLP